jgi:hypothetical protein
MVMVVPVLLYFCGNRCLRRETGREFKQQKLNTQEQSNVALDIFPLYEQIAECRDN